MNNFDTSTNGVSLDLNCEYDTWLSQDNFNENFKKLGDSWQFIDYGNFIEKDISDRKYYKATIKELKQSIIEYCGNAKEATEQSNYYIGKPFSWLSKDELFELIENIIDNRSDLIEFYQENFKPLYEVLAVCGYSQGDYAEVVFFEEDIKQYNFKDRAEFLTGMRSYFINLFYNSPIYCRLTIDDYEIYFDEALKSASGS